MTATDFTAGTVLLSGIVGSVAYGLQTPSSDVDRLGVYAAPTIAFHGLHPPVGKAASKVSTQPDVTLHEAGKLAALCLGGNPTVTELLWLSEYETITPLGLELIDIRSAFLSARKVRDAFLGYAGAQFRRLANRPDGTFSADTRHRTAKHARHLRRLCHSGFLLYSTGHLVIRLEDPQTFLDFGDRVAGGDIQAARDLIANYEEKFDECFTVLPQRPNEAKVEAWLYRVRAAHYGDPVATGAMTLAEARRDRDLPPLTALRRTSL